MIFEHQRKNLFFYDSRTSSNSEEYFRIKFVNKLIFQEFNNNLILDQKPKTIYNNGLFFKTFIQRLGIYLNVKKTSIPN